MKTTRVLGVLFFGMFVQTALFAQTVNFIVVSKIHDFTQTNNSTVVDATNPWTFEAHVEGNTLAGLGTPTLTKPSGTGSTTMTYNAGGDKWNLKNSYVDQASLDTAYGSGNYTMTAASQLISPISLTGDIYPSSPAAPLASLSGGTIVGGILTWNVGQALTITINGTASHMAINISGTSYNGDNDAFGVSTLSFTIPASSMIVGNNYNVELDFDNIVGGSLGHFTGTGAMASVDYAGVYTAATSFTIQAIPEPSTYAAIFGAVALAGVMIHRRRRQAA